MALCPSFKVSATLRQPMIEPLSVLLTWQQSGGDKEEMSQGREVETKTDSH